MAGIPTRKQLVRGLRRYTPRTMERTIAYNDRTDGNEVNAVSWAGCGGARVLREMAGLPVTVVRHPLMEAPFDTLPRPIPVPEPDGFMSGTLRRAAEDWPGMEEQVSLEAVRSLARQS
jgi:hypothetical protein